MPYQPYQSTWINPYVQPQIPQQLVGQQPYQQNGYQQGGQKKVNGPQSALQYPVPPNGQSDPLFDMNGKTFYIVSADSSGYKTLEAFDFFPHKEEKPINIDGAQFVSRQEYDSFVAKVSAALEALNGVHGPVSASGSATNGTQGKNVDAAADDAGRPISTHTSGSGVGGYMRDA